MKRSSFFTTLLLAIVLFWAGTITVHSQKSWLKILGKKLLKGAVSMTLREVPEYAWNNYFKKKSSVRDNNPISVYIYNQYNSYITINVTEDGNNWKQYNIPPFYTLYYETQYNPSIGVYLPNGQLCIIHWSGTYYL